MNTYKEAASPLLTTQTIPSGSGVCRSPLSQDQESRNYMIEVSTVSGD